MGNYENSKKEDRTFDGKGYGGSFKKSQRPLTHWCWGKMAGIFQMIFSNAFSSIKLYECRLGFHWSFFLKKPIQIMAWCWLGDKSLSEPMMVSLLMHICITRPQWVKRIHRVDRMDVLSICVFLDCTNFIPWCLTTWLMIYVSWSDCFSNWRFWQSVTDTVETLYNTMSTQYVALWTHKRHPIPRPFGRAMECLLWVLEQKLIML